MLLYVYIYLFIYLPLNVSTIRRLHNTLNYISPAVSITVSESKSAKLQLSFYIHTYYSTT